MKKLFNLSLIIGVILTMTFAGCKKYENGPAFSLASKKSRVINIWKVEKATGATGQDYTAYYVGYTIEFKKDNTYIEIDGSSSESGTWAFDGNKLNLILTPNAHTSGQVYLILKLKSKELWLKDIYNSYELHYAQK